MMWPRKISHNKDLHKYYIFHQDMGDMEMAWYIGDGEVFLTKIKLEDIYNGFYVSWDEDWEWDKKNIEKAPEKKEENPCRWRHEWIKYVGFTDTFDYCKNCGKKREENE